MNGVEIETGIIHFLKNLRNRMLLYPLYYICKLCGVVRIYVHIFTTSKFIFTKRIFYLNYFNLLGNNFYGKFKEL